MYKQVREGDIWIASSLLSMRQKLQHKFRIVKIFNKTKDTVEYKVMERKYRSQVDLEKRGKGQRI